MVVLKVIIIHYILYGARPLRMGIALQRGEAVKLHINDCWIAYQEANIGCILTPEYSGQGIFPLRTRMQRGESDQ